MDIDTACLMEAQDIIYEHLELGIEKDLKSLNPQFLTLCEACLRTSSEFGPFRGSVMCLPVSNGDSPPQATISELAITEKCPARFTRVRGWQALLARIQTS